jgi:diadenosine tetraphosphatase ApaH/serine/threonine PP2A family protein phosphatase
MRIVLLSDIHSNEPAMRAVLDALPAHDHIWCLGDTIGYGPNPNECLREMRERAQHVLTGNHDLASLGAISLVTFNPLARAANEWNNKQLDDELRAYLAERPARIDLDAEFQPYPPERADRSAQDAATLAHASPRDPVWEYVLDEVVAKENLAHFTAPICFIGHSHVPLVFAYHLGPSLEFGHAEAAYVVELKPDSRYIVNPGSVGQPRDSDPRAAFAVWDTEAHTITFHRVQYDVAETQRRMREAKLPSALAERLALGR